MTGDTSPAVIGTFVGIETAFGFSAFLPSVFTIRHFAAQNGTRSNVRIGEGLGVAWALAIGTVASVLIDHPAPLYFSVVASAGMVAVYEWCLANPDAQPEQMT